VGHGIGIVNRHKFAKTRLVFINLPIPEEIERKEKSCRLFSYLLTAFRPLEAHLSQYIRGLNTNSGKTRQKNSDLNNYSICAYDYNIIINFNE
jgi:hypothetical protein